MLETTVRGARLGPTQTHEELTHMCMTRRKLRLTSVTAIATVAVVGLGGGASAYAKKAPVRKSKAPAVAGTWSGQYSGAFSGTFTLNWTKNGKNLRGTIKLSNPSGSYTCTGKIEGSKLTFGAVGAGARYTGSISGASMSGSYTTGRGGGSWSATKG
jgi:hypothetical protein